LGELEPQLGNMGLEDGDFAALRDRFFGQVVGLLAVVLQLRALSEGRDVR
jgi:hypothetical protein